MTPVEADLGPEVDGAGPDAARSAVYTGVWVSAARCVVQYVVAPALGLVGFWLPWLTLLVQILACLITVSAALHLHAVRDHRRHWYAAIALAVLASTAWALVHPLLV